MVQYIELRGTVVLLNIVVIAVVLPSFNYLSLIGRLPRNKVYKVNPTQGYRGDTFCHLLSYSPLTRLYYSCYPVGLSLSFGRSESGIKWDTAFW